MKRFFTFFFALVATTTLWAYDFQSGDLYYNITSSSEPYTVEVTSSGSSGYSGSVTIPETVTYDGTTYSVTSIGVNAFLWNYGLTSITIPNSVTSIGEGAFNGCSGLTSITIGNSVTSIGDYAFYYCESLTSITIPNSVTEIGTYAFSYCSGLTSVTIPNSVTSIGGGAFDECTGLTSVTIGSGVTSIGNYAFNNCSSLTSVTIPNSVTSIGRGAFYGCSGLTSVTIGSGITSIGNYAFYQCSSLVVVNVEATTPPTWGADVFSSSPTCNIPCGTLDAYQASYWQSYVGQFVEQCSDDSGDDGDMDKDLTIIFSDQDNNELSAQSITLYVPLAPEIEGFTFLYWQPVAAPLDDVITIQAVYESNTPTEAPEVFVNPSNPAQKLIRNGQVYILQEDKMYTISGQVVK